MIPDAEDRSLAEQVFTALGSGQFHSGEKLARSLGVSRSAIWKAVQGLQRDGADIEAISNRGYRLREGLSVLSAPLIAARLDPRVRDSVQSLEVAWTIPSTNTALLAIPEITPGKAQVLLAENQTAGRGRRGRPWLATLGGNLSLSIGWSFQEMPRDLAALSLVIGVCVLRALEAEGVSGVRLKWPNDLLIGDAKLGGILIEMRAESSGPVHVVIGIGLNMMLGKQALEDVAASGTRAIDLASLPRGPIDRNLLAAHLVSRVLEALPRFAHEGFEAYGEAWRAADALRGRTITVKLAEQEEVGIARGIDAGGSLLVETRDGLRRYMAGEVSVRPRP